ncbi:hypothetical protein [Paenibacillus elgii]|uniref:hypothetical protein n=1 Tax=Paenibacillus elgii TaxID=189691 RepID=UPI002042400C|nr:hypothetical protein [Paenibacillus elgii]MCM3272604.1 hypothetical protein [Paenibacillus elgii]
MQVNMFFEYAFAVLFLASMILLNFVIFKIPVKENDKQITVLALIVGSANYYFKFVLHSPYAFVLQIILYTVFLMLLRRYPIFYSFIVSLTGFIVISLIDAIVTIAGLQLKITTNELMVHNFYHYVGMHLATIILTLLIAYTIHKAKIGFSFVIRRFSGKYSLRSYNFIWAAILIIGTIVLQFLSVGFSIYSMHKYILIVFSLILIISIFYAYLQNKKALKDRRSKPADS